MRSLNQRAAAAWIIALIALVGCAHLDVVRIGDGDRVTKGVRFWRPAPYLLVTETDGKPTASIVWLPNPDEQYAVRSHEGLGSLEYTATVENGWNLTSLTEKRDPKVPETIDSLTKLLTAVNPASAQGAREPIGDIKHFQPGLYRLKWDDTTGWTLPADAIRTTPATPAQP